MKRTGNKPAFFKANNLRIKNCLLTRRVIVFAATVLIAVGAFSALTGGRPCIYYLQVGLGATGDIAWQCEVSPGDPVLLNYVHSADGTPVSSVFAVTAEGLKLVEEKYSWYGSGLEAGSGFSFAYSEDTVTVSNYDRVFEELPVRVARTVPQQIVVGETVVDLNHLAPGGSLLRITVERKEKACFMNSVLQRSCH